MVIFDFIKDFLNNNIGVVTFFVGSIAVFLYIKQKADNKRDAAKLILQEIRYAEQQIRNHRITDQSNYYLADKLLPTNSWHKNIHYFLTDIKEPASLDLISRFYSHAQYLDLLIDRISSIKSGWWLVDGKPVLPPVIITNTQPVPNPQSTGSPSQPLTSIKESTMELNASIILMEVSSKVEFIYNTPAVQKLREIAEKKWYQLF